MPISTVGPGLVYVCWRCKPHYSNETDFYSEAENHVGRKCCHFCKETPHALDIIPYDWSK